MKIAQISTGVGSYAVVIPNHTVLGDDFYISYNDYDTSVYGSVTTALVLGAMESFYILNGDHRAAYSSLIDKGYDACYNYFLANVKLINKYSEKP